MPPERTSRPRQDPVSCQFCRTKKLKCNRDQPCQNCLARGIECERKGSLPAARSQHAHVPADNTNILARLQRLEDIVLGSKRAESPADGAGSQRRAQPVGTFQVSEREKVHKADAEWLESISLREDSLVRIVQVLYSEAKLNIGLSSLNSLMASSFVLDPFSKPCQTLQRLIRIRMEQ